MSDTPTAPKTRHEVVALFADRDRLETAIMDLFDKGFDRTAISVLATHESIDALDSEDKTLKDRLYPLLDEARYEIPLVAAGLIALASGPVGAAVAGGLAVGIGGLALKEFLDETTSVPDSEATAEALKKGQIMLWVAVENSAEQQTAVAAMTECGGADVHVHDHEAPSQTDD